MADENMFPAQKKIYPVVHLNGSGRTALQKQYKNAYEKSNEALQAHNEATPHARDYYPLGDGMYAMALRQHEERAEKLRCVCDEMMALWESVTNDGA